MFSSFAEIESQILGAGEKARVALCCAQDKHALAAVADARGHGVVEATLVGPRSEIENALRELGESLDDYEIVNAQTPAEASTCAMELVRDGRADIEMKGGLPSADFLLPILNPFGGLVELGDTLSTVGVFFSPSDGRLLFETDPALNIHPTLEQKVAIINNAVDLARAFGLTQVNVAALSALEKVNPEVPGSEDACTLAQMDWPQGVSVAGPFALDNALDEACARDKGISSPIAGKAHVLLMPDINAGNIFHKSLHYFGGAEIASVLCGTKKPVVFTSRSDTPRMKYCAILAAILQSRARRG